MALKIRLARGGSKKHPFYRIVVAEASSPRDGRFVERLGSYDPMVPKDHENRVSLKDERIKFWMSKGAKPTLRVHKILAAAGLLDAPIIREQPIKAAPGKKRLERENEATVSNGRQYAQMARKRATYQKRRGKKRKIGVTRLFILFFRLASQSLLIQLFAMRFLPDQNKFCTEMQRSMLQLTSASVVCFCATRLARCVASIS